MKNLIEKCPLCGHDNIEVKTVETEVRGGNDTVLLKIEAEVCLHCGERFYSQESMELFDTTRKKLKEGEHDGLKQVGRVFQPV